MNEICRAIKHKLSRKTNMKERTWEQTLRIHSISERGGLRVWNVFKYDINITDFTIALK